MNDRRTKLLRAMQRAKLKKAIDAWRQFKMNDTAEFELTAEKLSVIYGALRTAERVLSGDSAKECGDLANELDAWIGSLGDES